MGCVECRETTAFHNAGECKKMKMPNGDVVWVIARADESSPFELTHFIPHRVGDDGAQSEHAVERANGDKEWWRDGKLMRVNAAGVTCGPAIVRVNGDQEWYEDGVLHRDGLAAIIRANGDQEWHRRGALHRVGGPAISREDGSSEWWFNGVRDRADGPAVTNANGDVEWWCAGVRYDSRAEWARVVA